MRTGRLIKVLPILLVLALVTEVQAVHAFMNPAAGSDQATGVTYDARAARRSWRYMQDFFKEIFVKGRD
jgi:dienelactone hydrolase